ncbi:MAG: hypothetical protein P1U34_03420 [Coxiellaceae bacterium]|nr:hypothetical protein [Coxiellaceae bacterium]
MLITDVTINKGAEKQIKKLPGHIILKLAAWIEGIETDGLMYMRTIPGLNDEALKGRRKGQRSIRLNKAYRAIYIIGLKNRIHLVEIIEVNKHDY